MEWLWEWIWTKNASAVDVEWCPNQGWSKVSLGRDRQRPESQLARLVGLRVGSRRFVFAPWIQSHHDLVSLPEPISITHYCVSGPEWIFERFLGRCHAMLRSGRTRAFTAPQEEDQLRIRQSYVHFVFFALKRNTLFYSRLSSEQHLYKAGQIRVSFISPHPQIVDRGVTPAVNIPA